MIHYNHTKHTRYTTYDTDPQHMGFVLQLWSAEALHRGFSQTHMRAADAGTCQFQLFTKQLLMYFVLLDQYTLCHHALPMKFLCSLKTFMTPCLYGCGVIYNLLTN